MKHELKSVKEIVWQEISPGLFESKELDQRLAMSEVYRLMQEMSHELTKNSPYRRVKALFGNLN
jgi:hypothetical protein